MMELPHDASSSDYGDPIRRLLTLGETPLSDPAKWPDYVAEFGLGSCARRRQLRPCWLTCGWLTRTIGQRESFLWCSA